jgi:hypothetical protein
MKKFVMALGGRQKMATYTTTNQKHPSATGDILEKTCNRQRPQWERFRMASLNLPPTHTHTQFFTRDTHALIPLGPYCHQIRYRRLQGGQGKCHVTRIHHFHLGEDACTHVRVEKPWHTSLDLVMYRLLGG